MVFAGGKRFFLALVGAGLAAAAVGCGTNGPTSADHNVYFEGNVYDGSGAGVLMKAQINSISIEYRDKLIRVDIDDSGRFTTKDPLPTWQDYVVTIQADGFRPFVSHNPGFEVPASLAGMQQGLAEISTTQTFNFDAYLFPSTLTAPAMTLTVATVDDMTGNMGALGKAAGTIRLRPTTQSTVQIGAVDTSTATPRASRRVWSNDNDLLTSTLTDMFTAGTYNVMKDKLVYGVQYEVSIYDVDGYQPYDSATDPKGSQNFVAGNVMSKTFQLAKIGKDPLRITASTATTCTPPAPNATTPGATIVLTFSEPIEVVGTTYAEDVDNGLSIQEVPSFGCPLKSGFASPTMQERGTSVTIAGSMMTFSWNPSVGLTPSMDPMNPGFTLCTAPTSITSVTYGISTIQVQPKGDPTRKAFLSAMLQQFNPSGLTSLTCPGH
jgi:hypothetical protein